MHQNIFPTLHKVASRAGRNSDGVLGRWVASERTPSRIEALAIGGSGGLFVAVAGYAASVAVMDVTHYFDVVVL